MSLCALVMRPPKDRNRGYNARAWKNGCTERFDPYHLKEEQMYLSEYRDFIDALTLIEYFEEDIYMTKCIHSSLGYQTPFEYEIAW